MYRPTWVNRYLPPPSGMTTGKSDVPWSCAGIHGTMSSVRPSRGAPSDVFFTVISTVTVPRDGGSGVVTTSTESAPEALVTVIGSEDPRAPEQPTGPAVTTTTGAAAAHRRERNVANMTTHLLASRAHETPAIARRSGAATARRARTDSRGGAPGMGRPQTAAARGGGVGGASRPRPGGMPARATARSSLRAAGRPSRTAGGDVTGSSALP